MGFKNTLLEPEIPNQTRYMCKVLTRFETCIIAKSLNNPTAIVKYFSQHLKKK